MNHNLAVARCRSHPLLKAFSIVFQSIRLAPYLHIRPRVHRWWVMMTPAIWKNTYSNNFTYWFSIAIFFDHRVNPINQTSVYKLVTLVINYTPSKLGTIEKLSCFTGIHVSNTRTIKGLPYSSNGMGIDGISTMLLEPVHTLQVAGSKKLWLGRRNMSKLPANWPTINKWTYPSLVGPVPSVLTVQQPQLVASKYIHIPKSQASIPRFT